MNRLAALLIGLLAFLTASPGLGAPLKLERVVLIQRHGVRPPTSSNADLAKYAALPWPDWPVAPGELTPHGGQTVRLMGESLRRAYVDKGLLPTKGCPAAGAISVWADGASRRTQQSGQITSEALAPGCGLKAAWSPPLPKDPVFNGSPEDACKQDPDAGVAAMLAAAGDLDTPATRTAVARLQSILAPDACHGGKGTCFSGDDKIAATPIGPRLQGPLAIGASLSEDLLLEYAEGMPLQQVGWGKLRSAADIAAVMPVHEALFRGLRRDAYLGARQGALMARMVVAALNGEASGTTPGPTYGPHSRLVAFAGHDTSIAFMGAVFGLDWSLPGEPDVTSPAQTLALEVWADPATGKRYLRPVMYYETLDQLRTLSPATARRVVLRFSPCTDARDGSCSLTEISRRVLALVPKDCGELAPAQSILRQ